MFGHRLAALSYLIAVVATVATLAIYVALGLGGKDTAFSLFLLPMMLSAYLGGLGPGLLAVALAALLTNYLLISPQYMLTISSAADGTRWAVMISVGVLGCILSEGLHRARRRAEANQQIYAVTLASIGDAVIATDVQGRVTFLNSEAGRLTGWADGAVGRPLDVVFPIVNEETRASVESPTSKVLRTDAVVGMANHTLLISRDGREIPIDDSGAPIRDGVGRTLGVVLVFRDVTEQRAAEEALRESESRFRQLAESLPQLVWTSSPEGVCDYLSQRWVDYTGIPEAEQLGYGWLEQVHPDDRERTIATWVAAVERGADAHVEFRVRRHDGVYRWFDTRAVRLCDASGATVKWFGSNTDINDQRQITADLKRSERTLKLFVEYAPAAIAMFDTNMRYLAVSRRFIADYGVEGQDLIGRSHYEIFPEISEHWKQIHRRCLGGVIETCDEDPFPRADGTLDWVHWEIHPWYEGATTVGGIMLFSEVITARKTAEIALRESEARFHQTLDTMLEGCQIIGFDWRYLYLNDSIVRHARFPREELIGRTMMEAFPGIEETKLFGLLRLCLEQRSSQRTENLFVYPDGTSAWFDLSIQPIPEGLFILSIDISDRKQAEADLDAERALLAERVAERTAELRLTNADLARATRLKDEFLANMSHELRTPLTAILGRTELLQEGIYGPIAPRQAESLRGIDASGRHLLALINDILDLSKIEAGKIEIEPMPIVVESICRSSLQMVTQDARAKRIGMHTTYDSRVSLIHGDERRLKQILVNLLTNAVKFTPAGGSIGLEVRGDTLVRPGQLHRLGYWHRHRRRGDPAPISALRADRPRPEPPV